VQEKEQNFPLNNLLHLVRWLDCWLELYTTQQPAQLMWPVQELCHAGVELVVEIEEICPSKENVEKCRKM